MRSLLLVPVVLVLSAGAAAQPSLTVSADLVSRYVWRGVDFGQAASVQPGLRFARGGVAVGTWGSFALTDAAANELDLYASYTAGPLTIGVTDYYFPTSGAPDYGVASSSDVFNFRDGGEGAHYLEPYVAFAGPPSVPVTLFAGVMAYNDPEYSTYVEAGYGLGVGETTLTLTAGAVATLDPRDASDPANAFEGSDLYDTQNAFAVTHLALTAARTIPLTDRFSLPVYGRLIVNPEYERAFLVFGVTL